MGDGTDVLSQEERKMKKLFLALLAGLMVAGCATKKDPEPTPEPTPEATAETGTEENLGGEMLGGWTVNTDYNQLMGEDEIELFNSAMEGLVGVGYTPIQVIATQLVSGTNYAYLASGTTVTAEPETNYYVVVVYQNLQGETEVTAINQIDLADVKTKEADDGAKVGSWEIRDTGKMGMLPGQETESSFEEATKELLGVTLNPVVLFGTQVVAGTNYKALCRGKTATEDPQLNLYVVTWNTDPEGKSSVVSNEVFDIEYYVTPQQ